MSVPPGADLVVTATCWCGPACCVTRGRSLSLSGPQRRSFQRLLFTISTEGRLLQSEKSEAGRVAWGAERGLGGGGAGARRTRTHREPCAGCQLGELQEGRVGAQTTLLGASQLRALLPREVREGASWGC